MQKFIQMIKDNWLTSALVVVVVVLMGAGILVYRHNVKVAQGIANDKSMFVEQLGMKLDFLSEVVNKMAEIEKSGRDESSSVAKLGAGKVLSAKQLEKFLADFESFNAKYANNKKFATQKELFDAFMKEKKWKEADLAFVMQKMVELFSTVNITVLKQSIVPEIEKNKKVVNESNELSDEDKAMLTTKMSNILNTLSGMGNFELKAEEMALVKDNNERIRKVFEGLQKFFVK